MRNVYDQKGSFNSKKAKPPSVEESSDDLSSSESAGSSVDCDNDLNT